MQTMKNDFSSNQSGAKKTSGQGRQKGSPVTEERAKAQRAKLDTQVKARQIQEEQETVAQKTLQKKAARQDLQAKRRL